MRDAFTGGMEIPEDDPASPKPEEPYYRYNFSINPNAWMLG
jgi:hypothetical protein